MLRKKVVKKVVLGEKAQESESPNPTPSENTGTETVATELPNPVVNIGGDSGEQLASESQEPESLTSKPEPELPASELQELESPESEPTLESLESEPELESTSESSAPESESESTTLEPQKPENPKPESSESSRPIFIRETVLPGETDFGPHLFENRSEETVGNAKTGEDGIPPAEDVQPVGNSRKTGMIVMTSIAILALLAAILMAMSFSKNTKAEVTAFSVAGRSADMTKINGNILNVQVPFETNLNELQLVRVTVSPKATSGLKDSSMVIFSQGRKDFKVTAGDKRTTKVWHVLVTKLPNTEVKIGELTIPGLVGDLHVDDNSITAVVRHGTDISNLSPDISFSEGASMDPPSGTSQNFVEGPVTYRVTAQDKKTFKDYVVTVKVEEKDLSIVQKGDGIDSPFIRQYLLDPEYWGYNGADDPASKKEWAGRKAHLTAIGIGRVDYETNKEVWVEMPGVSYALSKNENGETVVTQRNSAGEQTRVSVVPDDIRNAVFAEDLQSYEFVNHNTGVEEFQEESQKDSSKTVEAGKNVGIGNGNVISEIEPIVLSGNLSVPTNDFSAVYVCKI